MLMSGNSHTGFLFRFNIDSAKRRRIPPEDGGSLTSILVNLDPRLRHSGTSSTGLFSVYLLIRKRAVLRYIFRLLAVYVCLLVNIRVF